MKFQILIIFLFISSFSYAQNNSPLLIGNQNSYINENGVMLQKTSTSPVIIDKNATPVRTPIINTNSPLNNTAFRWTLKDPVAIVNTCNVSGNGLYEAATWYLNSQRISLYQNTNNTPLWEHIENTNYNPTYTALSDSGNIIAATSSYNIYMFNRGSSTPFFNFDLTTLPDTGFGLALGLTKNGKFLLTSANRQDSTWIMFFSKDSTHWVWRYRVGESRPNGAVIFGITLSGNDSLAVVNTYYDFYIFKTFTGQLLYKNSINPLNPYGTQTKMGISGNGSIVATVNNQGYLRVFQRADTTYNFLWQHLEPPGTYYNWMTSVDVSYDGTYIASGTLNFLTSSTYDGKVKLFKTATGSTPLWTYSGMGDEVSSVSFSKNSKILTAVSWGGLNVPVNNLLVFKVPNNLNQPIFAYTGAGSYSWCSTSNDGLTVIAGGKKVHARAFGNGGEIDNIAVDTSDIPLSVHNISMIPKSYALRQNFPNPFNPVTKIKFDLPNNTKVKIIIYDISGREISQLVNNNLSAGSYEIEWNGNDFASGVYFYKMQTESFADVKRMILIK